MAYRDHYYKSTSFRKLGLDGRPSSVFIFAPVVYLFIYFKLMQHHQWHHQ